MKIGILGAGQLGRMLALAGYPLGLDFVFLDPAEQACAAPLGDHLHASFDDTVALQEFCDTCAVATYEFENVPAASAEFVAAHRALYPAPTALAASQDRLNEKRLFDALGIPVPRYLPVATPEALKLAVQSVGLPAVLKTRRMGYDGKGQAVLRTPQDILPAWQQLCPTQPQALILEAFVPFEREVSCLVVRARDGQVAFYPLVENIHRDGILHLSRPGAADPLQAQAEQHVRALVEHLDYVGVLAFEFFVAQGQLYANEIAPRVHNSGHWTIEGAEVSQFENHLRAVAGWPLGSTALRGCSAMVNLIGDVPDKTALMAIPGLHLHLYGKTPKPQRKVGHVTLTAADHGELKQRLALLEPLLNAAH